MKWFVQLLKDCSLSSGKKEFIRTSCVASSTYLAQKRSNVHERYLAFVQYGGGGRRGFIVILEGVKGRE